MVCKAMHFSPEFLDGLLLAAVMLDEEPTSMLGEDLIAAWGPRWHRYRSLSRREKHARVRKILASLRPNRLSPTSPSSAPSSPPTGFLPETDDPALARYLEYWRQSESEVRW